MPLLDLRGLFAVLVLFRHDEFLFILQDAFPHLREIASRPNQEDHEENREPCVEVERDCLQEQLKSIDIAALRQGRTHGRCPARNRCDDTDRRRRCIDDVSDLRAGDLELIRNRAHDRTNGQTVEIIQ